MVYNVESKKIFESQKSKFQSYKSLVSLNPLENLKVTQYILGNFMVSSAKRYGSEY